jgi:hypothetical protein
VAWFDRLNTNPVRMGERDVSTTIDVPRKDANRRQRMHKHGCQSQHGANARISGLSLMAGSGSP